MEKKEVYVKITKDGPYLVYGVPSIKQHILVADEEGACTQYAETKVFETPSNPVALCRCGNSSNSPFCDGTHSSCHFDGTETASFEPILNNAKKYEGPKLNLADNEEFCALARFCDAHGSIWSLVFKDDEESAKETVKQANLCPSGRLLVFDKSGKLLEDNLEESVSILEDSGLKISGPIWLQGKIRVESENGESYEIRNKQTLCRCGGSKNKPFCDSTHCHMEFKAKYK